MTNPVVVSFLYSQFMMHHFCTFEHEPRKALKIKLQSKVSGCDAGCCQGRFSVNEFPTYRNIYHCSILVPPVNVAEGRDSLGLPDTSVSFQLLWESTWNQGAQFTPLGAGGVAVWVTCCWTGNWVESSDLRARELPEAPVSSDIYWRFKKKRV